MNTMDELRAAVLNRQGFEGTIASKTLRLWWNEYKTCKRFKEDGRGKWNRSALMELFPDLKLKIKESVRTSKNVTCDIVRRFVSVLLRSEEATDAKLQELLKIRRVVV